jgi:hypothetical protein
MSNNTKAISFWNFLKENTIEIPIIQRDYAQGRLGKENLRKNFLADLKKALDSGETMKLDFVYGSTENDKLNPLDGQQRLTTLWLLHWYIALRAGILESNCEIFLKFTYETRISSREFCQHLCNPKHFENFYGNDIVGFITKQTWFYSAWKHDPTIQSMLRMLGGTKITDKKGEDIVDGIEELFMCPSNCDIEGKGNCALKRLFAHYWEKLVSEDAPIVFYHLPLHDFGLSDDLYIKMNARGEQLSSFENFKADLIGYIKKQTEKEDLDKKQKEEWKKLLDPSVGIPIKLDTDWTNIFWEHKSKDYKIDDIYFAFLNRFFLNELICLKDETKMEGDKTEIKYKFTANHLEEENKMFEYLYGDKGNDSKLKYNDLSVYQYSLDEKAMSSTKLFAGDAMHSEIPFQFFDSLQKTLNNYPNHKKKINKYFPIWVDSKFEFIPQYINEEITILGQKERIVFLSVCRYFENNSRSFDDNNFKQWMRVVWNIVENAGIDTISAMIGAIRLIDELSEHSHDIYSYLKGDPKIESGTAEDQVAEEIAKAKQILDENGNLRKYNGLCKKEDGSNYETWEDVIIEAERTAFFKGAIRFLFQNENGKADIDISTGIWDVDNFDTKFDNVKKYFDKNGVEKKYIVNSVLLRTLICYFDESKNFKEICYDNSKANWRDCILLNNDLCKSVHNMLMNGVINSFNNYTPKCNGISGKIQCQLVVKNLIYNIDEEGYYMLGDVDNGGTPYLHKWYAKHSSDIYLGDSIHDNTILSKLVDAEQVVCCQRISKTDFFRGEHINFQYNNFNYRWHANGYVYLMKKDWGYQENLSTANKETEENENYCFKVKEDITTDIFLRNLDKLIEDYKIHSQQAICNE